MADKSGEGTDLSGAAEVEMSEDSGVGSRDSMTTEETLSQCNLQSESGDSTHTVMEEQNYPAKTSSQDSAYPSVPSDKPGNVQTLTQASLPEGIVDPATRTEQWVDKTFDVFVKNLDGKFHTIHVEQFETVSAFKQKVSKKLGVPGEQQRLTSQEGKTLADDNMSLHDYNIKKHSTVYCQGRLRGGQAQV